MLIIEKTIQYIEKYKTPQELLKFGFFGSYTKNNNSADIDILVFEEGLSDLRNGLLIDEIYKSIIMEKNINSELLNNFSKGVYEYLNNLSDYIEMPAIIGLGPAINPPYSKYLHINASFTENLWLEFSNTFPIHTTLIANNYLPIVGGKAPVAPKLSKIDFKNYFILMDRRFENFEITKPYLRKIVKTIALYFNCDSIDYSDCLEYLFIKRKISKDLYACLFTLDDKLTFKEVYKSLKKVFDD